ncbi:MAG: hypothetical protein E6J00_02215 [Chloroflexi bacterium]|nr:MAG: hypothetical protein E6J00_02215 [Chloroflexota bacterium]
MADRSAARCSFCGKRRDQVKTLVAGPGVFICDQCVALCTEIISQDQPPRDPAGAPGARHGRVAGSWFIRVIRGRRRAPAR